AGIKGVNGETIARTVSFVGMGLAGLGGMLLGLDTSIDPLTGFRAILSIFAAAVVGGLGSVPGAVVGALVVGIGEELSLLILSPNYRSGVGGPLRADGARAQRHLGHGRPGEPRARRLLRGRRLCVGAAHAQARRAD